MWCIAPKDFKHTHIPKGFLLYILWKRIQPRRRRGKRKVIDGPYLHLHTNKVCQKGSYNLTALLYFALQAAMIFMLVQNFYPLNMHLWPILCIHKVKDIPQSPISDRMKIANSFDIRTFVLSPQYHFTFIHTKMSSQQPP